MNHVLRKTVLPWQPLSGMGNWSYAVITDWIDPRDGSVMPGTFGPKVFPNSDEARDFAVEECRTWPYRSEACYLTEDGKYLPLADHQPKSEHG